MPSHIFTRLGLWDVHFRETAPSLVPGFVSDEGGQARIWVRTLDSLEAQRIPGTEGGRFPFWSPDGESLGFFA